MIREVFSVRPGVKPPVNRFRCVECGEEFETCRLAVEDEVDHHCPGTAWGAWWIVKRGCA